MSGPRPKGYYRGRVARLRELWGGACVMCGNDREDRLEFAHLPGKPTGLGGQGRGLSRRYHDIRKHPGSYVLLCVECHVELDGRGGEERPRAWNGRFFPRKPNIA